MADDGPVPMDVVNVGTHDARTTQSDQDASHDLSCVRSHEKEQARKGQTEQERGIVEKEPRNGRVAEEMTGERNEVRRARRAANLTGMVTRTKEALETKAEAKTRAKAKPDIATIAESKGVSE